MLHLRATEVSRRRRANRSLLPGRSSPKTSASTCVPWFPGEQSRQGLYRIHREDHRPVMDNRLRFATQPPSPSATPDRRGSGFSQRLWATYDSTDTTDLERSALAALCCANIAPVAACQLVGASTDPDGGWHTEACHPVQRVASNLCFDLLAGQSSGEESPSDDGFIPIHCSLNKASSV